MANHESKFTVDNDALTEEATKNAAEQFKRIIDSDVLTELVKAFPPEDELDEFNSLVGLQHRPKIGFKTRYGIVQTPDAGGTPKANPRRINLSTAHGLVIEVWGTGDSGSDE